jgi:hypothetical protein
MTRTEFDDAYREARMALKTMAALPGDRRMGRTITREQRQRAEACWIVGVKSSRAPAFLAAGAACHLSGTISNAALYDLRHCGGERRGWYLRMAREKRERA